MEYILKAAPAIISGIILAIVFGVGRCVKEKVKTRVDYMKDLDKKVASTHDKIDEMKESTDKKIEDIKDVLSDISEELKILVPLTKGTMTNLKFRIERLFYIYYNQNGEITLPDKEQFMYMVDIYLDLGGDESILDCVELIKQLPIVKEYKLKTVVTKD